MNINQRNMGSSIARDNLQTVQRGTLGYTWRGINCMKNPFDFALYFKLIWDLRPGTIIEIGSNRGGSAVWLADMCRTYGLATRVWSIDLEKVTDVEDEKVTFLKGDAMRLGDVLNPATLAAMPRPWLVLEDSAHLYETSLAVLEFFHTSFQPGDYIVVEDGNVDDMGRSAEFHGGPNRAIKEFFSEKQQSYELDTAFCDYWGHNLTWNTNGFWRRVA